MHLQSARCKILYRCANSAGALISLTIRIRPTGHGYRDIPQGYREKKVATNGEGDSG